MPATPARIEFVRTEFRNVIAGPDAGVILRHGSLARDVAADDPVETFFADPADAQVLANERLALMSPDRRRWQAQLAQAGSLALSLDSSQAVPCCTVVDPLSLSEHAAAVVSVRIDLASGGVSMGVWG